MKEYAAFVLYSLCFVKFSLSVCPNECHGNGNCDKYSRCTCYQGYTGADCSLRICPYGIAWADQATATDVAHSKMECSNRGLCDRKKGKCKCMDGFTGSACERLTCPNDCNNYGICNSMQRLAADTRDDNSNSYHYDTNWDATKIFGCRCDVSHTGYDCSEFVCPDGDDPLTTGQVNEIQLLKCTAVSGSFVLYYKGYPSKTIAWNTNVHGFLEAMAQIPLITALKVNFSLNGTICRPIPNIVQIEFTEQFGDLPPLVPLPNSAMTDVGGSVVVVADGATDLIDANGIKFSSVVGNKEAGVCANRGLCNYDTGTCTCFSSNGDAYASSNGYGAAGTRGDCGFVKSAGSGAVDSCPSDIQCSGHGVCSTDTYSCACSDGWVSADCSERSCPSGLSWFSYPSGDNKAHYDMTECADMGSCDRNTGLCVCHSGFYGQACEYMECGGGLDNPCNGNGRCLSMYELAEYSENNGDATSFTYGLDPNNAATWDGHRVFGCLCDKEFEGYDCSLKSCPLGDDAGTYDDRTAEQLLLCVATDGHFSLSFRQQSTPLLSYNCTANELEKALESLSSIANDITVTYLNLTAGFCSKLGEGLARVKFDTVHGNLPALIPDTTSLANGFSSNGAAGTGTISVFINGESALNYTSVTGTTETAVCNNRGLCDYSTGTCECMSGWGSSDGKGGVGSLGDCGYRKPL